MTTPYCQACLAADPLPKTDRCKRCTELDLPRAAEWIAGQMAADISAAAYDELQRIKTAQQRREAAHA